MVKIIQFEWSRQGRLENCEIKDIDFTKAKVGFINRINNCVKSCCQRKGIHKQSLCEWKTRFTELVDHITEHFKETL